MEQNKVLNKEELLKLFSDKKVDDIEANASNDVDNLIDKYVERGGEIFTIYGSLLDNYIMFGNGLKTTIAREKYLNEWSSAYTIIKYNETPKKYQKIIELLDADDYEKAEKLFFNLKGGK